MTWGNWLVGQTWSNFMDVATLPESVDFIGPTDGTTFVRQPQVRYTTGGFSLSAENRETTILPYDVAGVAGARIISDDGYAPDLTARYAWKGDWGHVAVAGLLRELTHETATIDDSTWAGSLSLSGKFNFGKDDIRWMALYGNLGRYVGLNFATDAVLDANGNLDSLDGYAGFIAYRHIWGGSGAWRSTFTYSLQEYDNESILGNSAANKSSSSWNVNLFYSPIPKLDIGAEYRQATAERENGRRRRPRSVAADDQVLVLISRAAWTATRRAPLSTHRPRAVNSRTISFMSVANSNAVAPAASRPSVPTVTRTRARSR